MKKVVTVWGDLNRSGEPWNEIEVQHQVYNKYSTPSISTDEVTVWIGPHLVGVYGERGRDSQGHVAEAV